jgi:hypothetical protein
MHLRHELRTEESIPTFQSMLTLYSAAAAMARAAPAAARTEARQLASRPDSALSSDPFSQMRSLQGG